jgi:predicted amidohydrolase
MKALDLTGQAIRSGARLIVFPETFISGYPKGIDLPNLTRFIPKLRVSFIYGLATNLAPDIVSRWMFSIY